MFGEFKKAVSKPMFKVIIAAPACLPFAAAHAGQCSELEKNDHGLTVSAASSAYIFSKQDRGNVGVAVYGGDDLKKAGYTAEQIGSYLVKEIEKQQGIDAQCYIAKAPNGSAVIFSVDGLNVPRNAVNLLTAIDEETLRTVKGEAILVQQIGK